MLEDLIPEFKANRDADYGFNPIVKLCSTSKINLFETIYTTFAWLYASTDISRQRLGRERRRITSYLRSFTRPRPVFLGAIFPTLRPGGVVLPTDDWRPIC